ncbi:MAG: hypothetical protein BWY31_01109 [Lentisphaerae bacterium ADurb.Bin242]|nr:MAG: hypothetical protein BWY31_01109 [Lentisphaerae bacterium ADurb.Bin242]
MMTKSSSCGGIQSHLFKPLLRDIVSPHHAMVKLADTIDWRSFEDGLEECFCADNGRPSCPVRLMVALHYLKYASGMSDEAVLDEWLENPYWQYLSGGIYFEHDYPTDQSSLSRWRKKLAKSGAEKMLEESLKTGLRSGFIKKTELKRVNVDSTVQEKAIRYPTDARFYDRMRERLVKSARNHGIELRQTYERVGKKILRSQSGYARANQFKRARKATKRLKTCLGRVVRDIERKAADPVPELAKLLKLGHRLLSQKKSDQQKLYSIHEPQVECIGKGKAHKKFEFGTKVGLVTTAKTNWIVGAEAYPGNPYDGHTLKSVLEQTSKLLGHEPEMAICDLGYRGHNYEGNCNVQVVNRFRKRVPGSLCRWWNRRSAIEPVIGHVKAEHRMERNSLKGRLGDELNVIFAAAGFNFRKLLRAFTLFLCLIFKFAFFPSACPWGKCCAKRVGKGNAREGKNRSREVLPFSYPTFA